MTVARLAEIRRILFKIADDMSRDALEMDGKPFNARTVGEGFGNQGAAIKALAELVSELAAEIEP